MTTSYEVDSGVEIPRKKKITRDMFPFEKMNIGDSFLIPNDKKIEGRLRYLISIISDKKFTTRRMSDKCIRCWRVK